MSTPSPAETAPLQAPPGPLEPTKTVRFKSGDGLPLYGEWFEAPSPRAIALIVHGYAEHCGRYRELANVLVASGLSTLSYDMRGHGRAEGQRGHVNSYDEYLADLDAATAELARLADAPNLPILLVTHSNGGLIAMRSLSDPRRHKRNKRVDSAILSSPFLGLKVKVPAVKGLVGRIAGLVAPTLSLQNELAIDDLTHDSQKLAERRMDTLCHEVASARWFTSALYTQDYVRSLAQHVKLPTLWLVAGADRIADADAARTVHRRLRVPSRLEMFPRMYHEIFNETERARAFDHVRAWVDERFPL